MDLLNIHFQRSSDSLSPKGKGSGFYDDIGLLRSSRPLVLYEQGGTGRIARRRDLVSSFAPDAWSPDGFVPAFDIEVQEPGHRRVVVYDRSRSTFLVSPD